MPARIAILVVVGGVVIYLYAQYIRRTSMFAPLRYPEGDWDTSSLPIKPEEHWFTTSDDVRLHSWLFRAREKDAPLMIYFHGNAGNLGERAPVSSNLAARGVSVLDFDWRGYGRSDGTPTESGLFKDALAAHDFARTITTKIALYGESLGGPYAAYVAKERGARCVVIENSFASLTEIGNSIYAPIPLGWAAPFALTTARWLNQAGVPVLVMHGKPDEVIPFKLGMSLYKQLRVPKELLVSETAGHCEIAAVEHDRYYDTVTRFVKSGGGQTSSPVLPMR